jgi:hypothetical protein
MNTTTQTDPLAEIEAFFTSGGARTSAETVTVRTARFFECLDAARAQLAAPDAPGVMSDEPKLPDAFGYLCDWGNDSYGLTRQTIYYGEPGSATVDDWNEYPKVHHNTQVFTADQLQAYARQYAQWNATKRVVPDGWRLERKGFEGLPRIVLTSQDGRSWSWTNDRDTGTSNDLMYAFLDAMLTAAQAAPTDAGPSAPWLSLAHTICNENMIAAGHITERLNSLRSRLDDHRAADEAWAKAPAVRECGEVLLTLKELEWIGHRLTSGGIYTAPSCPLCHRFKHRNAHAPGCKLAAAIAQAQAQAQQGAGS